MACDLGNDVSGGPETIDPQSPCVARHDEGPVTDQTRAQ
jgi:hypothetical protein